MTIHTIARHETVTKQVTTYDVELECNNCGQRVPVLGPVRWLLITHHPASADTTTFGEVPPPFDMCSWKCIADYAAKRKP